MGGWWRSERTDDDDTADMPGCGCCAGGGRLLGRLRWCWSMADPAGMAVTLADRIDELVAQHGSLRALARVMECSPPYICRLRAGVTKNPGPAVLRKLGLRRVVSYERLKPPNVM